MAQNHHNQHNDRNVLHPHLMPMSTYLKVAGALFGLTLMSVIAHNFKAELGAFAAPLAFLFAMVKATFVLLYFMHLKDDTNSNRVIFASGFVFLLVLLLFSVMDIWTRAVEISPL